MRLRTAALVITLAAALAALDGPLERHRPMDGARDSVAVALAGEFRTVFANLLWVKVEEYHDEFIAHNADWTKNTDALGLNRMITKLDPHFEEAYATGARMLLGEGKPGQARAYLDEGVTNNPNSMMLHDELGTLLACHLHDYGQALFHLKRAYILAGDDWDRRRLHRLIGTVETLSRSAPPANSPI